MKKNIEKKQKIFSQDYSSLPEIIFIMGTGRTGTTILEILLANNHQIFGAGELTHIFRDGFLADKTCSCGQPTSSCEIWKRVLSINQWNTKDFIAISNTFQSVEKHSKFPLLVLNMIRSKTLREYGLVNKNLFDAVRQVTNAKIVIDSSKYPGRALALAKHYPEKIKVLCITRSLSGLIESFKKKNKEEQKPKSTLNVVIYYFYVLLCMWHVRKKFGNRCLTIRFEDLQKEPIGLMKIIIEWSGYDFSESLAKLKNDDLFDVGHIVTGNRLRKKKKVRYIRGMISENLFIKSRFLIETLDEYRKILKF